MENGDSKKHVETHCINSDQIDFGPSDLEFKVCETSGGEFWAFSNYSYWGREQSQEYHRHGEGKTIEGAIKSLIIYFKNWHKKYYSLVDYCWVPKYNNLDREFMKDKVILGSGEWITRKEFKELSRKRRLNKEISQN